MRRKVHKARKHVIRRINYQEKRSGYEYHVKRRHRLKHWKLGKASYYFTPKNVAPVNLLAPLELSFIDKTDSLLDYINLSKYYLKKHLPIRIDLTKIKKLTPDAIPFLISQVNYFKHTFSPRVHGNAPENEELRKLFTESGFYDHVASKGKIKSGDGNLMHKESNFKVKPEIAGRGTRLAVENRDFSEDQVESIYNIFIELMSNTHHHANLKEYGITKWWLYVYSNKKTNTTSISFLDLGVGIFKSLVVRNYFTKLGKNLKIINNIDFVDDLISGKIASRIEADNEIRGKGIPQIISYSKMNIFKKFYFITNNVRVDLKTNTKVKLRNNFHGTFFYIELCPLSNIISDNGS